MRREEGGGEGPGKQTRLLLTRSDLCVDQRRDSSLLWPLVSKTGKALRCAFAARTLSVTFGQWK